MKKRKAAIQMIADAMLLQPVVLMELPDDILAPGEVCIERKKKTRPKFCPVMR